MLKRIWLHFILISIHRWYVFKLACKAGIPLRGLIHDLSKYSPTEFIESAKYYQGNRSPINMARQEKGYSSAWLHHKGRNKHHIEYWYDWNVKVTPVIPYKYTIEMLCDHVAAGLVYKGREWTKEYTLYYWNNIDSTRNLYNPKIEEFLTKMKETLAKEGIDYVFNKKFLKEQYNKICK